MKLDLSRSGIVAYELERYQDRIKAADVKLKSGQEGYVGWVDLPINYDKEEIKRIITVAERIKKQCEAFVVIGVGGSYLGAKACIEMLGHSFHNFLDPSERKSPQIFFAGLNISGTYHAELLEVLKNKEVCICVISKSGNTTEPNIAFSIFKDFMYEKYGEEAKERIYAITDEKHGSLRAETDEQGYESFVIPDDIGGRYSVLTPVGLLPIAVAGIDIMEILRGAEDGYHRYQHPSLSNPCFGYAAVRDILNGRGKQIEAFSFYEPKLYYFGEWLRQLFGESEGKDGKGIYPSLLQFTTDLHSMGQFIQEGTQIFFETVLNVTSPVKDIVIPQSADPCLRGKSMNFVNHAAVQGVSAAHAADSVPLVTIEITELSPYYFGRMTYFFEKTCAIRGYLLDVNPFDQPGVEKYKSYMRAVLESDGVSKPQNINSGYEEDKWSREFGE